MVEYRKIKTLDGLTKEPTQDKAEKIPETLAAVRTHDDEDVTVTVTPQSALTSDCWLVQFNGFRSCADCEYYLKKDCGGGKTLAYMIIKHFQDSIMTKYHFDNYWGGEPEIEDKTFYNFVKWTADKYVFRFSYKKYKNHIKDLKITAEDPDGPDLDSWHPFLETFEDPNNKIVEQTGYHQHHQCDCVKTTKKGSYRDVTIEQYDIHGRLHRTLHYYHQHLIVVNEKGDYWISTAGYRTSTTRERINRYLPNGWILYTKKRVWYLNKNYSRTGPNIRFYDGIKLERSLI